MRVLTLSWEYPPKIIGGISRHVGSICPELAELGIDMGVITLEHKDCKEFEEISKVKIFRMPSFYITPKDFMDSVKEFNFTFLEGAMKFIKKFGKIDLVHAHDWLVAYPAITLKRAYSIPLIATIHATERGRNHGIWNEMQKAINTIEWHLTYEANVIICCSNFMKEEIKSDFKVPEDKIRVIFNGVDAEKYKIKFDKKEFRKKYADFSEKIVFYVGRMVREKGIEVLVESIPKVLASFPSAKFLIVGGGYTEHLKRRAAELGVYHKVYFTGFVDDETLLKIYKIADCAVYPSLYEPFGIVALEAMAAEVPCITSDIGGFKEIVKHDITGIHTWANNPDSLAWGILEVLKNPSKSKILVKNAIQDVKKIFNWKKIARKTLKVYEEVV